MAGFTRLDLGNPEQKYARPDLCRGSLVRRGGLPVALLFLIAACGSGPPVQEMSDARQAIAVAREAGAEERAAQQLKDAEALLDRAQQKLSDRDYDEARQNALQAKLKALDALARAENPPRND
jgi:hypothetical protein